MPTYPLTGSAAADLEARLANFRLAQTRLGFMNPTLRCTVNGTDRTSLIYKRSVRITRSIEGPSSCTLQVHDFTPVEGQEIKIAIGYISNLIFAGHITKVEQIADGLQSNVKYSLTCQDYTWLMDRRMVLAAYGSDNVDSIINRVFSSYVTGFTTNHVQQGLGFLSGGVTFTMETVSGVLRRLAKEVDAYWYIDPTKDLHFFSSDAVPRPHDLTSSYKDFENVALTTDLSQVKTRVYVEGQGTTLTAQWTYNSTPLNVVDNTMFTDGVLNDRIRIAQATHLFSSLTGTTQINLNTFGGATSQQLHDYPSFPIGSDVNILQLVEDTTAQTALAALEGGDGIHDHYVQDRRLSRTGAQERGQAELNRYANPVETLTYRTHDPNTRPGAPITVSLSSPTSISGTFTIQNVTITNIEDAVNRHPWYDVVATSQRRTLWDIYRDVILKKDRLDPI